MRRVTSDGGGERRDGGEGRPASGTERDQASGTRPRRTKSCSFMTNPTFTAVPSQRRALVSVEKLLGFTDADSF